MTADPHKWRIEQYMAMGFSHDEANALSHSKDDHGFHVYHGDFKRRLDAGMTRKAALEYFVSEGVKV